jgi:predicted secreted protein
MHYQLVFGNADTIDGSFKITSYERSGEFNGEETYSITLESSGQITFTAGIINSWKKLMDGK